MRFPIGCSPFPAHERIYDRSNLDNMVDPLVSIPGILRLFVYDLPLSSLHLTL